VSDRAVNTIIKCKFERLTEYRQNEGSYCLLSFKKSHVSHHVIFITARAQNVGLQHHHERECIDLDAMYRILSAAIWRNKRWRW